MTDVTGFIVADNKGIIHGMGPTGMEALKDATSNVGLFLWPATQELLTKLGPWRVVDGIAMTETEAAG